MRRRSKAKRGNIVEGGFCHKGERLSLSLSFVMGGLRKFSVAEKGSRPSFIDQLQWSTLEALRGFPTRFDSELRLEQKAPRRDEAFLRITPYKLCAQKSLFFVEKMACFLGVGGWGPETFGVLSRQH